MKFAPMAIPAMALLQQHDSRRDILIEPAAFSDRSSGAFGTEGIWNCGRNRAVKTHRLVFPFSQWMQYISLQPFQLSYFKPTVSSSSSSSSSQPLYVSHIHTAQKHFII